MAPVTGLQRTSDRLSIRLACALLGVALLLGCGDSGSDGSTAANTLSGAIRIDGSSTVYPVSTVAAEYFGDEHPRVRISVGRSGTSAGMNKFLEGEIDICDASRPITESEILTAQQKGIGFVEFAVAQDGMAVVVNKENDWCDVITVDELKAIWRPEAADTIKNWSQVNDGWPD
ncbi:MAG: substrate-binding domain-containing protein, partial [Planctomycetota bacterium]